MLNSPIVSSGRTWSNRGASAALIGVADGRNVAPTSATISAENNLRVITTWLLSQLRWLLTVIVSCASGSYPLAAAEVSTNWSATAGRRPRPQRSLRTSGVLGLRNLLGVDRPLGLVAGRRSAQRWWSGLPPAGCRQVMISGVGVVLVVGERFPLPEELLHIIDRDRKSQAFPEHSFHVGHPDHL